MSAVEMIPPGAQTNLTTLPALDWARLDFRGDCWEWMAGRDSGGYGKFRNQYVHRIVWQALVGSLATGDHIDHLCRNRACANPDHLEPTTSRVNVLRGYGWAGRNARRTHCPQGHERTPENRYTRKDGRTHCRPCAMARSLARAQADPESNRKRANSWYWANRERVAATAKAKAALKNRQEK